MPAHPQPRRRCRYRVAVSDRLQTLGRRGPDSNEKSGSRRYVPRRPAHPLQILSCLQPGLRPRTPRMVGAPQGDHRASGTGDFTHPGWAEELRESLVPAEPGLFRLGEDAEDRLRHASPRQLRRRRAVHAFRGDIDDLPAAASGQGKSTTFSTRRHWRRRTASPGALSRIGNLASDGRPILGLDSRHLLEITLDGGPGCYLVPAHAWTPWFAVLGSKSGFDVVADCYGDLALEVFAIETGLSSDPAMNWRCSSLDGYRLVSNSDAHSPPMLGREATTFDTSVDYFAMADALRTGDGLAGTIEFYPEEGKYHLDGHRKCGVRFEPGQSRDHEGACPECGKPLTIGVLHRVTELADRPAGYRPPGAPGFTNLVQLPQIVGEIMAVGPKSKKVGAEVDRLVAALGPELGILTQADIDDLRRVGGSLLAEAVSRLRRGEVRREAGYDGEYGVVSLFVPGELNPADALFDLASPATAARGPQDPRASPRGLRARPPGARGRPASPRGLPAGGRRPGRPAGPRRARPRSRPAGRGGGREPADDRRRTRNRQDAHADPPDRRRDRAPGEPGARRAWRSRSPGAPPRRCARRLAALLAGGAAADITVTTFHGLGLMILREHHEQAGLAAGLPRGRRRGAA